MADEPSAAGQEVEMSLSGKVAVVTGAAGDVGAAVVKILASRGARVLAVDIDPARLTTLAAEEVEICTADVTRPADVTRYVSRAVELWGGIDLFFNDIDADGPVVPLCDYPEAAFEQVITANVRAAFLALKHVVPHVRDGGAVVNMASALSVVGAPGMGAYVAAKHAVLGLTKVAALECEPRGIRVHAVCPDPAARHHRPHGARPARRNTARRAESAPLNEYETPDDVAHLVAFLFSDAGPVHHRAEAFVEIILPGGDGLAVPE